MIFFKHPPEDLEFVGDYDLDKPYNEIIRRCMRLKSAVSVTDQQRLILMPLIIEGLISDVGGKLLPVMLIDLFEMSEARAEAGRKGGKSRKPLKIEANEKQIESKSEANTKQETSKLESSEEQNPSKHEADKIRKEETILEKKEQEIGYSSDFLKFWEIYPEKKSKGQAWSAWQKIKKPRPELSEMISGIEASKLTPKWRGGFIQHPATWLNARGWEDDPTPQRVTMTGGSPSDDYSSIAQKL